MVKVKSAKGKSKKSTWKKIRHPDVDNFLEEQRRDERLGIKEKTDDQLFFFDQLGFDDDFTELTKKRLEAKNKATLKRNKEGPLVNLADLRCFQILKPDSNVKDPVIKRNPILKGGGRKTLDMKVKDEARSLRRRVKSSFLALEDDSTGDKIPLDLWSTLLTDPRKQAVLDNEWLTGNTKRNIVRRSEHQPLRKTTELKQVEVPHPGLSYNPSFADHQDIIQKSVDITLAAIKAEKKIQRATFIPRVTKEDLEVKDEDVEVKTEAESDSEDDKSKLKKLSKPKTRQQKRKEREQKDQEMKAKNKKIKSKKESEVFRVRSLRKEIEKAEKLTKGRLQRKVDKKIIHDRVGVKRLSRFKFEELKPEPILSEDLVGALRGGVVSSSTDLLLDRFKSLQKRNVIEPRVKQSQKKKNRRKKFQRPSDKMEWEKTGKWNGEKLLLNNKNNRRRNQS